MQEEREILKAAKAGNVVAVRQALAANPRLISARDSDGSTMTVLIMIVNRCACAQQ